MRKDPIHLLRLKLRRGKKERKSAHAGGQERNILSWELYQQMTRRDFQKSFVLNRM